MRFIRAQRRVRTVCKGEHPRLWRVRESRRWLYFPKKNSTTEYNSVSTDRSNISGRVLQDIRAPALICAGGRSNWETCRLALCYMPSRSLFARTFSPVPTYIFDNGFPSLAFFCVFFIHHWNIFRIFAPAIRKECKTYCSIATQSPPYEYEQNKCYWSCTYRAQISHIHLWFVVNRVAYGESLRLLYFKTEESTG